MFTAEKSGREIITFAIAVPSTSGSSCTVNRNGGIGDVKKWGSKSKKKS